ncbi:hypothetical protein FK178_09690 [Antarcticibacterium arcticum]|uniref:Macroglobulin domain-containing protein n=1 Tax=Antarcticibacterium arcticum TaxID=2585771 RepID=A0A5B8YK22_9FLAO|nr:hypothetical protein [Antarcticibacterium arcticum]QED37981.1 hypothetical protein FK178_09690 [Antarcticibacterium arcticum]
MMRKTTILILAFLGCIPGINGQQSNRDVMEMPIDHEEVFVHYNTGFLIPGETLYYKFYCRNSRTKQLSTLSKVGYLELVDAEKNIIFKHKIALNDGHGQGDFFVPTSIASGNYKLIAYTRRMIVGPKEIFFEGNLSIVNPFQNEQQDLFSSSFSALKNTEANNLPTPSEQKSTHVAGRLEIQLENRLFEKRSNVNLVINHNSRNLTSTGVFSLSVRKIEDLEVVPRYTAQNYPSVINKRSIAFPVQLPELRGQLISGRILTNSMNEGDTGLNNKIVALSIPGDAFFLRLVKTNAMGRFTLNLENNDFVPRTFLQVLGEDRGKYTIVIDPDPSINYTSLEFEPLHLPVSFKDRIMEHSIYRQIENSYLEVKQDSLLWNGKSYPFYGVLPEVYHLDEFTRFKSLNEVFIEIVKMVRIRRMGGNPRLEIVGSFNEPTGANLIPLVMVDGVLLQDHSEIIDYDARKIKTIQVLREKYFMGPQVYRGIISFETIGGDFFDVMKKEFISDTEMVRPQQNKIYFSPSYQNLDYLQNRVPDFRLQLLWNPNFSLTNRATNVEFYTSDVPGEYEISIEGFTEDGTAVSLKEIIRVH